MIGHLRFLILIPLAFLSSATSGAGPVSDAELRQARFEELYIKAYDCHSHEEYVCSAYHFDMLLDVSKGIPTADLHRIKIDYAYSLYLMGKMEGFESFKSFFDMKEILFEAKDALFTSGYGASYIDSIITMELIQDVGVCNDESQSLIDEMHLDLSNRGKFPDKSEFSDIEKSSIGAKSDVIIDLSKECNAL